MEKRYEGRAYSEVRTYKLAFDFNVVHAKSKTISDFKAGEFFCFTRQAGGRFIALKDSAQIGLQVAMKVGRGMKKKMFIAV